MKKKEELNNKRKSDNKEIVKRLNVDDLQLETNVIDNINKNNQKLEIISVKKINILEMMKDDFDNDDSNVIEPFARQIENSCVKLINNRANLRKSLLLVLEILKLKPANLDATQKKYGMQLVVVVKISLNQH